MPLLSSISGIRGTLGGIPGESLTPIDIVQFTCAFASHIKRQKHKHSIVVGRDSRVSGEMIIGLVNNALRCMGFEVIDLGLSTTPTVSLATLMEKAGGGIVITASHNPMQWNALKLLNYRGEFISQKESEHVLELSQKSNFNFAPVHRLGKYREDNSYIKKHIKLVKKYPLVDAKAIRKAKFSVAVDGINSTGGIAVPMLLKELGVKTIKKIYCKPTGQFAHNPEPLPQHLTKLCGVMRGGEYDLGIAVDPDVDRLALIQENGKPFGEEYTLVAIVDYMLSLRKGNVVANLSSTLALRDITRKAGCTYRTSAVGEANVVRHMKKAKAVVGGEGNGGVIIPDFHYGRDALIGIGLLLTFLAKKNLKLSTLKRQYPYYYISKNRITLAPNINIEKLLKRIRATYANEYIDDRDGLKITFRRRAEWVHLRQSNTEPIMRIYAEAHLRKDAERIISTITKEIHNVISSKSFVS